MTIKKGSKVKVEYEGKLDDGTVFDSSKNQGKALEVEIGAGKLIPGFDKGMMGMKKGEEKEIKIDKDDAYGDPKPELVKKVNKDQLPKEQEVKPGMLLTVGLPNGSQIPARVTEVNDQEVTLDLNHPLAGKNLTFKVKVVEIS